VRSEVAAQRKTIEELKAVEKLAEEKMQAAASRTSDSRSADISL